MVPYVRQEILSRLDQLQDNNTKAATAPTEPNGEGTQSLPNATPRVPRVVEFPIRTSDLNSPPLVDGTSLHGKAVGGNMHKSPYAVFEHSPSASVIPSETPINMVNQRWSEFRTGVHIQVSPMLLHTNLNCSFMNISWLTS